uniref:Uncharacterized protein n=1 Tax=Cajanus cajan TaxID=3821 RepID=A0A151SF47_CAJCA|nr:hypothetical protein KK1_024698 [Cajanus cajan]
MHTSFLQIVGQNSRYCIICNIFGRSQFFTSDNFHKILKALNTIAPTLMTKPGSTVLAKIGESTRFFPFFKVRTNYLKIKIIIKFDTTIFIFPYDKVLYMLNFSIAFELLMGHIFQQW